MNTYPTLAITSDIHLDLYIPVYEPDFYSIALEEMFGDTKHQDMILCLAGDIFTDTKPSIDLIRHVLIQCKKYFKHVVWVAGNHDLWGYDILGQNSFDEQMINLNLEYGNIHYLTYEDTCIIDRVEFWGHTFWSKVESMASQTQIQSLKDYHNIHSENGEDLFVFHTNLINQRARAGLRRFLDSPKETQGYSVDKRVVMTHFPLFRNIPPEYPNPVDVYYNNHMDYDLAYMNQPDLYINGHTHDRYDHDFMGARVICHPRGYPSQGKDYKLKYVDLNGEV